MRLVSTASILVLVVGLTTGLVFFVSTAEAAVGFDTSDFVAVDLASSTVTGFTPSGVDRHLVVIAMARDDDSLGVTVSDITYGGTSLGSAVVTAETCAAGDRVRAEIWTLVNPTTAGGDVVTTWTGKAHHSVHVLSFTGVDQTTPNGDAQGAGGPDPDITLSSEVDDMTVDGFIRRLTGTDLVPDPGQTERTENSTGKHRAATSTEAGAASVSMGWTGGAVSCNAHVGLSIRAPSLVKHFRTGTPADNGEITEPATHLDRLDQTGSGPSCVEQSISPGNSIKAYDIKQAVTYEAGDWTLILDWNLNNRDAFSARVVVANAVGAEQSTIVDLGSTIVTQGPSSDQTLTVNKATPTTLLATERLAVFIINDMDETFSLRIGNFDSTCNTRLLTPALVAPTPESAFKDGASAPIPSGAPALIDSFVTTLPDATNLVLVFVQIEPAGGDRIIAAGDLEVRRGTLATDPLIAQNEFQMNMQRGASAPTGTFAFLLGRDTTPGSNPTYGLFAGASGPGLAAEAKFLILNDVPNSDFVDGGSVPLGSGEVTLATVATGLPDQPTVVIGAVQLDQTGGSSPDIATGNLRLKRGATVLASNEFLIETEPSANDGDGNFLLIVARDANPGASPTFSVTADPNNDNMINGEAKILAFSGLPSSYADTGAVTVATSRTVIGSTATSFAAGDDVLIGGFQMDATTGSDQTWAADRIDLARVSNQDRASNEFSMMIPQSGNPYDNSYVGLLNAVTTSSSSPSYEGAGQVAVSGSFDLELKLVAVHIKDAPVGCEALSVVTSDPAGQLWFNESVEPDGIPFTTQVNVSASFQGAATPALNVTNDGTGTCDITIRLMNDPGPGRSLKFNTTNDAPWPSDASQEVPLDPSSVVVCSSVLSGGTCDIWLWVDYENALGGQSVPDVRVQSL
ncbi:MAG: hypothetical protein ACE5I4_03965 [Thermoplasmata archaeon]